MSEQMLKNYPLCGECGKMFANKMNLGEHMIEHEEADTDGGSSENESENNDEYGHAEEVDTAKPNTEESEKRVTRGSVKNNGKMGKKILVMLKTNNVHHPKM